MEEFRELARAQLGRIKALCSQVGLKYAELPDPVIEIGVGFAVGFGADGYVILSVLAGGNEGKVMITNGLLKDIRQDRLAALNACNSMTSGNSLFPVYLHDAETGWSLLMQLTYPVDLLLGNPDYFAMIVPTTLQVAAQHRADLAEKYDLGGQPWQWTADDLGLLLLKSLLLWKMRGHIAPVEETWRTSQERLPAGSIR